MEKYDIEVFAVKSELDKNEIIKISTENGFQVFDLDSVASRLQIRLSYLHSAKAFQEKRNIAKNLPLEWIVRASGKRQIKEAIESVGIRDPNRIVVAFKRGKGINKKRILSLLSAKEIEWKEKDDKDEIGKMVELEIEE